MHKSDHELIYVFKNVPVSYIQFKDVTLGPSGVLRAWSDPSTFVKCQEERFDPGSSVNYLGRTASEVARELRISGMGVGKCVGRGKRMLDKEEIMREYLPQV